MSPAEGELFSHSKIYLDVIIFTKPTGMIAVDNILSSQIPQKGKHGEQRVNIWKCLFTLTFNPFMGLCHCTSVNIACLRQTRSILAEITTKKKKKITVELVHGVIKFDKIAPGRYCFTYFYC